MSDRPRPTCRRRRFPNLVAYEDWLGGCRRRFRVGQVRREHGLRPLLHLRHDRQPQGRALLAPLQRAARADRGQHRRCIGRQATDVVLPVVPMFHANAWATGLCRPMAGAKLVMPGAKLDGAASMSCWKGEGDDHRRRADGVADAAAAISRHQISSSPTLSAVMIGGSACPRVDDRDVREEIRRRGDACLGHDRDEPGRHHRLLRKSAWSDAASPNSSRSSRSRAARLFGVEMKITDDDGKELPHDGKAFGRLMVRGPSVAERISRARAADGLRRTTAGSTPATSPRSTNTASCRSPTAPRTSSNRAANGSPRSTSRISRSAIPASRRPPSSACRIPNGTSGRCSLWC